MKALVLGAGISGLAAADLATRLEYTVVGFDEDQRAVAKARSAGLDFQGGAWSAAMLDDVELVIASPGIPEHAPMIEDSLASGLPMWSELEFASRQANAPLLAVTGTNGKTSTVAATASMLEASGVKACAAGNIGTALSDVARDAWDVIVVEASSFQLRFTESFHPAGAAVLNVTPDHLDWHRTLAAYSAAKARITARQGAADLLAYGADDSEAESISQGSAARTVPVSGSRVPEGGAGVHDGVIYADGAEFRAPDLGPDFLTDLVAAAVLARSKGATDDGIRRGLETFMPGPHRRRSVGTWNGVEWVDDSKATNPHAAIAAAAAYRSVVLIAGGRNKSLDLSPMADMPTVRQVVTLGESADIIGRLFPPARVTRVTTLADAVDTADALAVEGDTVLLAPGCASFDMFASYAQRGDAFRDLVISRKGGADGN